MRMLLLIAISLGIFGCKLDDRSIRELEPEVTQNPNIVYKYLGSFDGDDLYRLETDEAVCYWVDGFSDEGGLSCAWKILDLEVD